MKSKISKLGSESATGYIFSFLILLHCDILTIMRQEIKNKVEMYDDSNILNKQPLLAQALLHN